MGMDRRVFLGAAGALASSPGIGLAQAPSPEPPTAVGPLKLFDLEELEEP